MPNFQAADISFETVILLGLMLGPGWAMLSALVLALPAEIRHEYLSAPFLCAVGLVAGVFGAWVEKEEVWSFTPFVDLSIYRWVRRNLRKPRFDRQILLLVLITGMEMVHVWLSSEYPHRLFAIGFGVEPAAGRGVAVRADGGGDHAQGVECVAH